MARMCRPSVPLGLPKRIFGRLKMQPWKSSRNCVRPRGLPATCLQTAWTWSSTSRRSHSSRLVCLGAPQLQFHKYCLRCHIQNRYLYRYLNLNHRPSQRLHAPCMTACPGHCRRQGLHLQGRCRFDNQIHRPTSVLDRSSAKNAPIRMVDSHISRRAASRTSPSPPIGTRTSSKANDAFQTCAVSASLRRIRRRARGMWGRRWALTAREGGPPEGDSV